MQADKQPRGVIVLGSINMDLVVQTPRMPTPGETVLGGRFFTTLGGKGANQAVAAARASQVAVTFVAAVGDDSFGQQALAVLQREARLDTRFIRVAAGHATGVATITVDPSGENMICVASGANATLSPADLDALPEEVWTNARVFLASLETPLETVLHGLKKARAHGLLTILNPAPAVAGAGSPELLRWVDIVTPNRGETMAMVAEHDAEEFGVPAARSPSADAASLARAAAHLRKQVCAAVIVTLGADGCLILADEVDLLPAHKTQAVDTTAAGDAFNGALAARLAAGANIDNAARWAMAAAAISVTRPGAIASLATRAEIDALMGGQENSH